jgi:hypothetical protein
MKTNLQNLLAAIFLLVLTTSSLSAQTEVLAGWSFGTSGSNSPIADLGNSNNLAIQNISITGVPGAFTYPAGSPGSSISISNWTSTDEKYWKIIVNTIGYQNLTISSKQQSSNTGPRDFQVQVSLDGAVWQVLDGGTVEVANNFIDGVLERVSIPGEFSNKALIHIRWLNTSDVSVNGGIVATAGTSRIDEILIEGEVKAEATTMASWDFTGAPGNQASSSGTGSENIATMDFERGSGLNATSAANSISASGWSIDQTLDYFSFGITVSPGFEAELEELIIATRSSGTGPGKIGLKYSVDNFESLIYEWDNVGTNFSNIKIDLSDLGKLSGTVEFRIVASLDINANGTGLIAAGGTLRVGNFMNSGVFEPVSLTGHVVESTVIIPEPENIVNWNFAGEPGNQVSTAPNFVAQGLLGMEFSRGSDINPASASNSISSNGWNAGENRYFSFGFSVAPDKLLDVIALQIGTRSSNTGPRDMALKYSGDGFSTNLATWTSENAFLNQTIDLSQLQNLTGTTEFRIVTLSNTSVNDGTIASGGTFRVTNYFPDNAGVTFIGILKDADQILLPQIVLNTSFLDFGNVILNQDSPVLSYSLAGENLTGSVSVSAPSSIVISKNNENYFSDLTFTKEELESSKTIFVKVVSSNPGAISESITHTTSGNFPVNLSISGQVIDPFNISEDFNTSCPTGLPSGWDAISILGDQVWSCTTFGRGDTPTASAAHGLQINGFAAGAPGLNEDWIITPTFDLTSFNYPLLSFWSRVAFSGPRLKLKISTDYVDGDPNLASWTEISDRFAQGDIWTYSEDIDLSAFKESAVRIAFQYISSPENNAARWTLDDFALRNSDTPPAPFLTTSIKPLDYYHFGIIPMGSVSGITSAFNFSLSNATENLTVSVGEGFELSKNGMDYFSSLVYTIEESGSNNMVFVRFAPAYDGAFSGQVKFESADILSLQSYLTGSTLESDKTLDVVTWNIEWFGSSQSGQGPTNVNLQLQNVKTIIEYLDADVYAFQEITSLNKFLELVTELEGKYGYAISPATSAGGEYAEEAQKLAFLFKKTTIDTLSTRALLSGVQAQDLANYPSDPSRFWASGRLPYLMSAKATIDGVEQRVDFINVHTRSNGGGESAANPRYAMRKYDVQVLKDTLDTHFADVPFILLGDYNDDLDETVANSSAPTVGTTETSFISYINDPENYTPVTITLSNFGLRSYITFENVIDHIIVSNEMDDLWIRNSEHIVVPFDLAANYQNTTSDHLPVNARFFVNCDVIAGEITGTSSFCIGNNVIDLMLVGGYYENIIGWELSEDDGETWTLIANTENLTQITMENLQKTTSFRVIQESRFCKIASATFTVEAISLPQPIMYFNKGRLVTIHGDYIYQWYKNRRLIATTSVNSIFIRGAGEYRVVITDKNGCSTGSSLYRFPQQLIKDLMVRIFPNPVKNQVTVNIVRWKGLHTIQIKTLWGHLLHSETTDFGSVTIDLSRLSPGIYIIQITDESGNSRIERLIKQ